MFQKILKERIVFVCRFCKKERFGSEAKNCGHQYRDYLIKDGETHKNLEKEISSEILKLIQ